MLLQTSNSAIRALVELRSTGVHIGLDDFGTGFSSLTDLQALPLDFIKIDRSFVKRIATDARSRAIVAAIIDLAHALDLTVVGEGIETHAQLFLLRGFGCDLGQGHLFARSLTASGLVGFLDDGAAAHLVVGGEHRRSSRSDLAHGWGRTGGPEAYATGVTGSQRTYSTTRSRRLGA